MTRSDSIGSTLPTSDLLSKARMGYTQVMIGANIVGEIIGLGVAFQSKDVSATGTLAQYAIMLLIFIAIDVGLVQLLRRRQAVNIVATVVILKVLAAVFVTATTQYTWFMVTTSIAVLTAATLSPRYIYMAVNIAVFGIIGYKVFTQHLETSINAADVTPDIALALMLIILSVTTRYFTNTTERATQAANKSARLLRAASETGEDLARMLNLKEILPRAVELISARFGFYHVQIFLIDDNGLTARLEASTGAIGQRLFERQHSLPVGSKSVIGTVTATGKMIVARDTDAFYYRNELLPNTRSELALPIFDGDKIIGALDMQSRTYDVFDAEVIQAVQALANQLGTSIRNARLFESQERNTRDTKRLFLESETSLREIQRLNQQLTHQGWQEYLDNRQASGITVDDDQIIVADDWNPTLTQASQTRQSSHSKRDGQSIVTVPVMLGNEAIGAIEVETDEHGGVEVEVMEMVQAVAQRLAISLDKARLFEESQAATSREQRINEIVGRYQTVTNVDELLRITLEELSQTLGAKRSAIRLGAVAAADLNGNGHS